MASSSRDKNFSTAILQHDNHLKNFSCIMEAKADIVKRRQVYLRRRTGENVERKYEQVQQRA
jgi:hypothetical protein